MIPSLRAGIAVVFALTTGFIWLDWEAYNDKFAALLTARLVLDAALVAFWFLAPRSPERSMQGAVLATGFGLVAVIGIAGGVTSSYYPGIMLLFLGMPVLLPLTARQSSWIVGVLFASFAALPVFGAEVAAREYMIHLFFPGAAALECIASSALLDRLRFQDHERRAEITRARDQLAVLDQAKTRFAANVHHELRTPLTLMLAPLEGIRAGDYGAVDPTVERTIRTMHVNGQRLLKLINNLLDLAKLESEQFEIHRAPLQLAALIENVVEGAVPMAERKELALRTEGLEALPGICADADALEKILVNLLGNALKFTDAGGVITVGTRPAEGGLDVYVRDTGIGLEPAQLGRVFDRFAQVDSSATRQHEGTGIGLSLTQELVGLHGGRVWADSEGIGHGATMYFFLPFGESDAEEEEPVLTTGDGTALQMGRSLAAVEAELGLEELERSRAADGRYVELDRSAQRWEERQGEVDAGDVSLGDADSRPQILVTDDNPDMRDLISFILGREFRVSTARDGREALDLLQSFEPDLIVSDIMMPEMSGTELCEAVKGDERLRDIPVMLVSSKAESEMKIEGLELGADDYVTKPFHPRELLVRARSHASLRRARRDLGERNDELERTLLELQIAEAQLVKSERLAAVGELAAGIAHEVNNPVNYSLNAVRAMTGAVGELREIAVDAASLDWGNAAKLKEQGDALRQKIETAGAEELAATIGELSAIASDGLDRTHRLVLDLRDFAAPGRADRSQRVDVRDGVRSTAQLVKHDLEPLGLKVELELSDDLSLVEGDSSALNQVFLNLIRNAADAMEGLTGSIVVGVFEGDGEVHIEVRDTGQGVAPDVMERLFEPFFTTKEAGRSSGLGLSMCRKIADAHGGYLKVESKVDIGSCFTLSLPAAPGEVDLRGDGDEIGAAGGSDAS
ncbi:MAG: ATP-binding protein [Myxococcota bacterium]|nr:ATP-binding protein [Myxococcota bacterium]